MTLNGIDISSWQSDINLANIPCDFVIVKATEGTGYVSPSFSKQYNQAKSLGKCLGIYHYANGGNVQQEAEHFLSIVKSYVGEAVLVLDWESGSNPTFGKNDLGWCKSFCDYVTSKIGVKPMIYIQQSAMNRLKGVGDYGLWIAQYADMNPTGYQTHPWNENAYTCAMRQYTSCGQLPGYGGRLDLNIFYGDKNAWNKYAGKGNSKPIQPMSKPESLNNNFKFDIGQNVTFGGVYMSSTQAATFNPNNGYVPASKLTKNYGKITKKLKINGHSIYLIDDGFGWINDGDVISNSSSTINRITSNGGYTVKYPTNIHNYPSKDAPVVDSYAPGDYFNYDSYVDINGYRWYSYISHSGVRRYVAKLD